MSSDIRKRGERGGTTGEMKAKIKGGIKRKAEGAETKEKETRGNAPRKGKKFEPMPTFRLEDFAITGVIPDTDGGATSGATTVVTSPRTCSPV